MITTYTLFHFSISLFIQGIQKDPQTVLAFSLANCLYIFFRIFLGKITYSKLQKFELLGLTSSILLAYLIPTSYTYYFSYVVSVVGIAYKLLEFVLVINVSFGISRTIRQGIEEDFNLNAFQLLFAALSMIIVGSWFKYQVFVLCREEYFYGVGYLLILGSTLEVLVILATILRSNYDCIVTNWAFFFLYSNCRLYMYTISNKLENEYDNFSLTDFIFEYTKRKIHFLFFKIFGEWKAQFRKRLQIWYCSSYLVLWCLCWQLYRL